MFPGLEHEEVQLLHVPNMLASEWNPQWRRVSTVMLIQTLLLLSHFWFVLCGDNQVRHNETRIKSNKMDSPFSVIPHISTKPEDVNVVVCAILKNEDAYVDEWIQYNKYLGVNHMQLYDNSLNGSAHIASLPHKYGDFVRVMHMPGMSKQKTAYIDCGKRYVERKYWAAFIDCDEFIVLRMHDSIQALLHSLMPHGGALSLFRVFFGSNNQTRYENKPVLSRFTMRGNGLDVYTKVIAYLPDVVHYGVHTVRVRNGTHLLDCHGNIMKHGRTPRPREAHEDVAVVYHYKTKSLEEFRLKRLRGDADQAHRGERYHKRNGEHSIKHEFLREDKNSYARRDTSALDFFERKKKEMGVFPPT